MMRSQSPDTLYSCGPESYTHYPRAAALYRPLVLPFPGRPGHCRASFHRVDWRVMPKPLSAADIELLNSRIAMLMEELSLADRYLFPGEGTVTRLAGRIKMLRAIEAGDTKALGGKTELSILRDGSMAAKIEEEIIGEVRSALRRPQDDPVFVDRLAAALRVANAGKVSQNLAKNATGAILLAVIQFRQKRGRRPTWDEAVRRVEAWRKDGLRHPDGTAPRKLSEKTLSRARKNLRVLFP